MTLLCKINWSVAASYSGARGRVTGAGTLSEAGAITLTNGTAAGQADGLFSVSPVLNAGDTHTYALSDGLVDLYGATLDFSAIKMILVEADAGNTQDLVLGGGTWAGPFGDPTNTVAVKPGCIFMMACQDANGWSVDDGADELQITCGAAGSYGLTLIGVSAAISPPGCATPPALVATPQVGQVCSCTDGDWSGAPVFSYQWTRGGSPIPGATGATYTPVQADVGRKIARVSFALNIAGGTRVSSAPLICQVTAGALDFSDPTNSGLIGH